MMDEPVNVDEEKKEAYTAFMISTMQREFTSLCMAYDCECGGRTYFVLDRFPMSHKVGFKCESCNKFDFRKIVTPFVYYSKVFGEIDSGHKILFKDENNPQAILLEQHIEFEKSIKRFEEVNNGL